MVDLPPVAGVQPRRQLIAYDTAGQVPVAQPQGGGELAPLLQAVMQGGQAVAEGFSLPEMMAQYARATDPVASQNMSGLERLFATNPAINTMAGSLFGRLPQGAVFGSSALRRQGDNALPQVDEIVAYHGSPHDFDKFQMDKIGTGEGAQAFGHGLYYTDLEDIATGYKDKLTQSSFVTVDGQVFDPYEKLSDGSYTIKNLNVRANLNKNDGDIDKAIERATDIIDKAPDEEAGILAAQDLALLENIKARGGLQKNKGKTYKVAIQSKLDDMLDYDEPLLDQPVKVQNAIRNIYKNFAYKNFPNTEPPNGWQTGKLTLEEMRHMGLSDNASGSNAYRLISEKLNPKKFTPKADMSTDQIRKGIKEEYKSGEVMMSDLLNREGINGMRYLDADSRNAPYEIKLFNKKGPYDTEKISATSKRQAEQLADNYKEKGFETEIVKSGTNNYVIFNEDLVNILAKYGIVGGAGLAAANEFSSPAQADSYPNYMPPQAPELDANPLPTLPPNMV